MKGEYILLVFVILFVIKLNKDITAKEKCIIIVRYIINVSQEKCFAREKNGNKAKFKIFKNDKSYPNVFHSIHNAYKQVSEK